MAKRRGVEAKLSQLKLLADDPLAPGLVKELRSALEDASSLVVASAAEIVGARGIKELAADMVAAFDRFMIEPEESDKQCRAKIALARALNVLEHESDAVFLAGLRHVQDPIYQSEDDAASPLRGECAFALARIAHPEVLLLLVDLLVDRSHVARNLAVQALGASGRTAAIPLLRYKALAGDPDPAVTAECLKSLMTLAPKESLDFVAKFLRVGNPEIQEGAAFALAESRHAEGLPLLLQFWPQSRRESLEDAILLAISMFRLPAAIDFLLEILRNEPRSAEGALTALAIHRHNDSIKTRVQEIVAGKKDAALKARYEKKFGG